MGPEVVTFRTKTLDFTLVIRLNWLEKVKLGGLGRAPCSSILFIVNNCYTRAVADLGGGDGGMHPPPPA